MTNHDIAKELDQITRRMDLMVEALKTMRELTESNSQRIDNMQDALFNLFPKKE